MRPRVSAIIPMHNEADNAADVVSAVREAFEKRGWDFEIVPVDDGSTDGTGDLLASLAASDPRVRPVTYRVNRGAGYALRRGFAAARGELVASIDADLSYGTHDLVRMIETLDEDADADVVVASPYMRGGAVEGVPFSRLAISRAGNLVLGAALPRRLHTITGIARAYRRETLERLPLESDGMEINLEILSHAMDLGMRIVEIPAKLSARTKGVSKSRLLPKVSSHLLFSILTRPAALFATAGIALFAAGLALGAALFSLYLRGALDPDRPLMAVMILLLLGGAAAFSFGVIASQLVEMRRGLTRLHSDARAHGPWSARRSEESDPCATDAEQPPGSIEAS